MTDELQEIIDAKVAVFPYKHLMSRIFGFPARRWLRNTIYIPSMLIH